MQKAKGIRRQWGRFRRSACDTFVGNGERCREAQRSRLHIPHSAFRVFSDAWIGGGWHTALAAAGLATDAGVRFGFPASRTALFAAFAGGGALTLYGGRYALRMIRGGTEEREAALRRAPPFALFSWMAGAAMAGAGAAALPAAFTLWTGLWGTFALAYCYPLLGRPWREYGKLKPALLALCWTTITCGPPESPEYGRTLAARLVWLAGLALAFDFKDVEKDRARGLRTPAATWDGRVFWAVVLICLVAGLIAKLLVVPAGLRWATVLAWLVSLAMLGRIRRSRSTRAWVVWGDGMMIVYALAPLPLLRLR